MVEHQAPRHGVVAPTDQACQLLGLVGFVGAKFLIGLKCLGQTGTGFKGFGGPLGADVHDRTHRVARISR